MSLSDAVAVEVHRRMTRRGLSARRLARSAGMPATLLHRAIAGHRRLSLDELERLADALGVSPEELVRHARGARRR